MSVCEAVPLSHSHQPHAFVRVTFFRGCYWRYSALLSTGALSRCHSDLEILVGNALMDLRRRRRVIHGTTRPLVVDSTEVLRDQ